MDSSKPAGLCIICRSFTDDGQALCGPDCRQDAVARREANATILRRLPHARRATRLRYQLATESGQLTSAILRYDSRR